MNTPELKVSATEDFMDPEEFKDCILSDKGIFLLAEEDKNIVGFIYANTEDIEKTRIIKWSCIVYVAVNPKFRGRNLATELYDSCIKELKTLGVTHVYAWANPHSGVIEFLKKKGMALGHECVWMDKEL